MKKITSSILLIIVSAGLAFAQNTVAHSTISFRLKNMGIGTGGNISGLQASVKFNPADLASSTLEASVETNTINTDNNSRDEHLRSEDFFDVAKYPKITLKSIAFKHKSGANYSGTFSLTIKNKTKQVEIPFTYTDKGTTAAFNGTFKLNRLDYGIGGTSLVMGDEVTVTIDAEATK